MSADTGIVVLYKEPKNSDDVLSKILGISTPENQDGSNAGDVHIIGHRVQTMLKSQEFDSW